MDLSAFRRRPSPPPSMATDPRSTALLKAQPRGGRAVNVSRILATALIILPVLVLLSIFFRDNRPSDRASLFADAGVLEKKDAQNAEVSASGSAQNTSLSDSGQPRDELLGGLLASGFDEGSCLSRYQSSSYRRPSPHKPSSYLISRLRNYESLHKRCGPHSEPYKKALEDLKSDRAVGSTECKYVVWISFSGLGNRILTLSSSFLYALLTNRVLLIDQGKDMVDLFCEPFPEASWLLPKDFPIANQFNSFGQSSPNCHGNLLKNNMIYHPEKPLPAYLYLHLVHDYNDHDKLFFCDEDQRAIEKVPWLIIKSDNYFIPSLFLMPSFERELFNLFPEKETIFHHLGRYLFHPSNHVWGLIARYFNSYLARADERVGIQVRTFDSGDGPFPYVMDQIIACTQKEKLLPEVNVRGTVSAPSGSSKLKAVLVTSLNLGYAENLKSMYWMHPTVTGEMVGIYQPSHEGHQQTEKPLHNRKAWAEMYLLSLSDVLVTSSWSTFGYVAQGLGGLKPWILVKPENRTTPNPPCGRAMSMEPCFHAPPFYDCKAKRGIDTGAVVPHVRHCEDISWGLKVVEGHQEL
ncbi:hypothetical protein CRG98_004155 [Punica granatum]|uniref:Fucosyltransferase n=1 Tax=Punica granatum TaxID=22663 RepID=A0A2I0L443_PUNGR|nr:hypothetical protein CRG98_004155 [Punica granatum]